MQFVYIGLMYQYEQLFSYNAYSIMNRIRYIVGGVSEGNEGWASLNWCEIGRADPIVLASLDRC